VSAVTGRIQGAAAQIAEGLPTAACEIVAAAKPADGLVTEGTGLNIAAHSPIAQVRLGWAILRGFARDGARMGEAAGTEDTPTSIDVALHSPATARTNVLALTAGTLELFYLGLLLLFQGFHGLSIILMQLAETLKPFDRGRRGQAAQVIQQDQVARSNAGAGHAIGLEKGQHKKLPFLSMKVHNFVINLGDIGHFVRNIFSQALTAQLS